MQKTLYLILMLLPILLFSQDVVFDAFPKHLQLYARDTQDSAVVEISGSVQTEDFSAIKLDVYKNDSILESLEQTLDYTSGQADFSFNPKIHAELSEYDFVVSLDEIEIARADSIVCGDIYLISGQSNSHPSAIDVYPFQSEFCRSFGRHTDYTDYDPADTTWGLSSSDASGNYVLFGVGTWGMKLQESILADYDIPTCILNGGSGGSDIDYNLPDTSDRMNLTTTYGRMLYRVTKAGIKNKIKAIIWHQGESDSTPQKAAVYFDKFSQLRTAWLSDYLSVEKIYVFQIHPGSCGGEGQSIMRETQRTFPESFPEVNVMSTVALSGHDGCHYSVDGYFEMASWVYRLIQRDFYSQQFENAVTPPNVQQVYYNNAQKTQIIVQFDQPVVWPEDTPDAAMVDYFYLNGNYGNISSGAVTGDGSQVLLQLIEPSSASQLTYLPNSNYNGSISAFRIYQGPWITSTIGVGALSFYNFPISSPSEISTEMNSTFDFHLAQNYPNPFNPVTKIAYRLPQNCNVHLSLYNLAGKEVRTLVNKQQNAGLQSVTLNGAELASGIYVYKLSTDNGYSATKKLILLK